MWQIKSLFTVSYYVGVSFPCPTDVDGNEAEATGILFSSLLYSCIHHKENTPGSY